jgi:hypothetical protein
LQAAGTQPSPDMAYALREAAELLARIAAPMVPHLAEQAWADLGHDSLVAETPWPVPEMALLQEETVTIAVQVNGKRRDELTIARDAPKEDIEAAALKLDNVVRAIGGRKIKKGVVVPQRIVNVVALPCLDRCARRGPDGARARRLRVPAALWRDHGRRRPAVRRNEDGQHHPDPRPGRAEASQ